MSGHFSYSKSQNLTRFFDKIRVCVDELQLQTEDEKISLNDNDLVDTPEDKLFGKITKKEFTSILQAYEAQQQISELQNKPVTSDRIAGQSYAKLLYSKIGFHHIGSTAQLVKNLGIKDHNRESYLGGHSTYDVKEGEDLLGLKKLEDQVIIKNLCQDAYKLLANGEFSNGKKKIDKAILIDEKSGNALAARGKYFASTGEHVTAVEDYSLAVKFKTDDMVGLHKNLSESLFHIALDIYHRGKYEDALGVFQESLRCDHENENAKLHIGLCRNKIQSKSAFRSGINQYRDC